MGFDDLCSTINFSSIFLTLAHPHAQSLFLFPIVFGINYILAVVFLRNIFLHRWTQVRRFGAMDASGGNHHICSTLRNGTLTRSLCMLLKLPDHGYPLLLPSLPAYFHRSYTSVNILTVWHATLTSNASLGEGRGRSRWVGGGGGEGDGLTVAMDLN